MIPVPAPVQESLARLFATTADALTHFGGGREDSDGVIYAYPQGDDRWLLKVLAIPLEEQRRSLFCLEERLRFVEYLGRHGAPVIRPQLSPQGALYETFPFAAHLWVGYCMEIAPGQPVPAERWDPRCFERWGRTIGQLHRLTREYPSWRASFDPVTGEELLTWRDEWKDFHEWCQDAEARAAWAEIGRALETLPVTRDAFGFIHNDPHIWNLLYDGERLTLLDFDVANHHWFVNDIAIACQSILFSQTGGMERPVHDREKLLAFLRHFMAGYKQEHHLSAEWLSRLDLFIAYRRILLFTVMQGWISSKPDLSASWKQMILTSPQIVGAL